MSSKIELHIPKHIAIIMDGNRRWARLHNLPEEEGHQAGSENLEKIVEAAGKMGIKTLTVYALSTENLRERSLREVKALLSILREGYQTKIQQLIKNSVSVQIIGELKGLPKDIQKMIEELKNTTIKSESIKVNIALNYGGKKELLSAVKKLIQDGIDVDKINEKMLEKHLYTNGQTDPELVIRTGGKVRLSNFLLWQTAYSELYFTKILWPDFDEKQLHKAIEWYSSQGRNFGKWVISHWSLVFSFLISPVNIALSSSADLNKVSTESLVTYFNLIAISSPAITSNIERWEIFKKRTNSGSVPAPVPSAIFKFIETAARRIWSVREYFSLLGNLSVNK